MHQTAELMYIGKPMPPAANNAACEPTTRQFIQTAKESSESTS
jgi:hypothetical protein